MRSTPRLAGSAEACWGLVLAAGGGRRFGGAKLLAPLEGRPLLAHALDVVCSAVAADVLRGALAVVPAGETRLSSMLAERGIRSVAKPGTEAGLGVSLRVGLEALAEVEPQPVSAALVFLGDQPRVRGDVVAGLVAAWRSGAAAVVRPRYAGAPQEPGHPVLLDRSVWALANELAGDAGLRDVLRADAVVRIDVPGSNPDVDTRRDLDALRREG